MKRFAFLFLALLLFAGTASAHGYRAGFGYGGYVQPVTFVQPLAFQPVVAPVYAAPLVQPLVQGYAAPLVQTFRVQRAFRAPVVFRHR